MKKNLTFSEEGTNRLTREKPVRSLFFGIFLGVPLSLFLGAFPETMVVAVTLLCFRGFVGVPPFSFLLWAGEILALGGAAAIFSESARDVFPTLSPFYWGVFLFLAVSAAFFAKRFFFPMAFLSVVLLCAFSGITDWISISLFAGAVGGIYPLMPKTMENVTFI